MASPSPSAGEGRSLPPPKALPVHDAIQLVLNKLATEHVLCADAMAALCRERAAEIAATPVPVAAPLVRSAVEAAMRALSTGDPSKRTDVPATLRHLLACPSLRDVAVKASRLKSLATSAIEATWQFGGVSCADAAVVSVLQVLQEAGVDITIAGLREESITPLAAALAFSVLGVAQVLLDAGADVNGLSRDGLTWPLCTAVCTRSDFGMALLLERGASLTMADKGGHTIAHALVTTEAADPGCRVAATAEFCSRGTEPAGGAGRKRLHAPDDRCCCGLRRKLNSAARARVGRCWSDCSWLDSLGACLLRGVATHRATAHRGGCSQWSGDATGVAAGSQGGTCCGEGSLRVRAGLRRVRCPVRGS